ncbi:MAG: hypothetical protein ACW986_06880 [Promethearchaeota archaeon]|jgi:hypothetical protein
MVKKNKNYAMAFILLILVISIFSVAIVYKADSKDLDLKGGSTQETFNNPKTADGPPLSYIAITRNATTIYRLFESVNFTIDTFGFSDIDYVLMQIQFSDDLTNHFPMVLSSPNKYSFEYKPPYDAPLGFQNVSFLLFNITDTLLNAHTTYSNFTIVTNYMGVTNNSEYYIGDDLYAEFTVNNFGSYQFDWNLTLVDSPIAVNQRNITNFGYNSVQLTYEITNETFFGNLDQFFYIKLNMTDRITGKTTAAYVPFKILNSDPTIFASSLVITPSEVFRDEEFEISVNVTDIEDLSEDLLVSLSVKDPEGKHVTTFSLDHNFDTNFSAQYSVGRNRPQGEYTLEISALDQNGGTSTFTTTLTVNNNLPEIHSYEINGISMNQRVSVLYGKNLVFSFNVSDVERVAYVKVALLDENNEWYNITREYIGEETRILIRTIDLITGVWYVYIYAIDFDGAATSLTDDYDKAPQGLTIIPDVLSIYVPWIVFIIGIILGVLAGVGLLYRRFKSKSVENKGQATKQKEVTSKKPTRKKKEKTVLPSEGEEKKTIDEIPPEDDKESAPRRKIKRKL